MHRLHHSQSVLQMGPPCSSDPMVGGPKSRSWREAWTTKDIQFLEGRKLKALDLNTTNREDRVKNRETMTEICSRGSVELYRNQEFRHELSTMVKLPPRAGDGYCEEYSYH